MGKTLILLAFIVLLAIYVEAQTQQPCEICLTLKLINLKTFSRIYFFYIFTVSNSNVQEAFNATRDLITKIADAFGTYIKELTPKKT